MKLVWLQCALNHMLKVDCHQLHGRISRLARTSKRVVVSDPVLNSNGHYTRRPFAGVLHNSGSEERVWPSETTQPHVENALTSTPTHETVIELCSFL